MRKVDNLGRIVIPKELRKKYGLNIGAELAFEDAVDGILVKASDTACRLCGGKLEKAYEIQLCRECINKVKIL